MFGLLLMLGATSFIFVQEHTVAAELSPGVVFEIEVKDYGHTPPKTDMMEVMVEGPNIVIPVSSNEGQVDNGKMIFRGDRGAKGEVTVVDGENKSYYVMDGTEMAGMSKQLSEAQKMMEEAMKNLTKEQREAIAKASQHGGPSLPGMGKPQSKPEVRKTSDRGEKQGYPCVKYEVFRDEKKIREVWTTAWDNIDGGEEAKGAFKGMGDFFTALWESIPAMTGGGNSFGRQNPYTVMNFENGFPVVSRGFGENGELEEESWLKGTRRQQIDPADFEPPSGYKRMSMGGRWVVGCGLRLGRVEVVGCTWDV